MEGTASAKGLQQAHGGRSPEPQSSQHNWKRKRGVQRGAAHFGCVTSLNPHGSVDWDCHHLQFIDEKTEAQRGHVALPTRTAPKTLSRDPHPGLPAPGLPLSPRPSPSPTAPPLCQAVPRPARIEVCFSSFSMVIKVTIDLLIRC